MSEKQSVPHSHPYPDYLFLDDLLTEEQKLTRDTVRSFVRNDLEPIVTNAFMEEEFPSFLPLAAGKVGILGSNLSGPGLPGMDSISYGLVMKEIERCDSGFRSFASVQGALVMFPINSFGSDEQKNKWLQPLAKGEAVGAFALTEPDGGSDPAAMKTRVEDRGDHWILNGSKMWVTNGSIADVVLVWARGPEGIAGFLVPKGLAGFEVREMQGRLSLRTSVTAELYFQNVKLPKSAQMPGTDGLGSALKCLNQARYGIAWGVIGAAEACFDEAVAYAKQRFLFGKTLDSFQLVQAKLSDLCTSITTAQLLAHRLGQLKDVGKMHPGHVSMAKKANVAMALNCARVCRDILGANGIMAEYKVMRHMCNLETVSTYEGTDDIHTLIVGQVITGKSAFK